jgi:hypothetical protein
MDRRQPKKPPDTSHGMPHKWPVSVSAALALAAATLVLGLAPSSSGVPINTLLPTITGYATPRSELDATNGSWSGRPVSYSYQWEDCNSSGMNCTNATGAASGPCSPVAYCYVVTSGEARWSDTIKVVVTATNANGETPATAAHVGPASTSEPVPCALTHTAGYDSTNSCWATHTGVEGATGYTKGRIEHGAPGFTHVRGNVIIRTPGVVIDHAWISGCIAINSGANNVTIKDSLITPADGDYCQSNVGGTHASAINDGQGSSAPTGLLIEDTTVDGGNAMGDQYGVSIVHASCIRCNVSGFADNYWSGDNGAAAPTLFQDDYSHDMTRNNQGSHMQAWMLDSSTYVKVEHSYAIMTGGQSYVTGAITLQSDWGPPRNITVDRSYAEGDNGMDMTGGCGTLNIVFTNNALSKDNGYSSTDYVGGFATRSTTSAHVGNTWTGNYVAESRTEAAPPPSGNPGKDGC